MDYEPEHTRGTTTRRTPTTHGHGQKHDHTPHTLDLDQGHAPAPRPALTPEQLAATQAINTMRVNGLLNRRFGPRTPATSAPAAPVSGQPDDYVHQVQQDLTAGNFGGALGLLDRHWPTGAHTPGMQEARAFIAGEIVARLHATLVPLTMERMLHTLEPVRPRLDAMLTAGHRLRDLLLASAASGLDRDRLAYAPMA